MESITDHLMGNKKADVNDAGTTNPEVPAEPHVRAEVYRDNQNFGQTLNAALGQQQERDNTVLQRFEQTGTPLEIVGDGQPVRLSQVSDYVTAIDDQGKPHRFQNQPITKLPVDFSSIPEWREKQITAKTDDLIKKYTDGRTPSGWRDGKLSFNDFSSMMKDIGKMTDLTEVEKCRLWSDIRIKVQERDIPILDADEKEEMIDSWKGSWDPYHALITMNDGYHGDRLINMKPEDATKAILDHENGAEAAQMPAPRRWLWEGAYWIKGPNTGDINASEGQLKALRELRSQGTFSAYANEWTRQFVRTDIDQYGRKR